MYRPALKDFKFEPVNVSGNPLGCRAVYIPTGKSVECGDYPKCFECNRRSAYARLWKILKGENDGGIVQNIPSS